METNNQDNTESEQEITIAHPSYEVSQTFMSLGFRETVVSNNQKKTKTFISYQEKIYQYTQTIVLNTKMKKLYSMHKIGCF
ncbi:MAG: hypothetical protein K8F52_01785 [Candidatus Scalindua rubra]|uniref:Putative phage protein n=1 Tax=Candidatus Scalindua brodae TaxID=237368 RepID=A0A0B0EGB3_9BACT|nr:MAG: putative phage protein [Candidatus Scalindua brodae]MBZ0107373.1 hypothetical protein [Candidatus Scalindua rubra]TWU31430.1 hypothetical protein S225a_21020 [Candidatus Brocadiaceae bacterium S225]